jgi:nitrous oxidase accessory protein NosD
MLTKVKNVLDITADTVADLASTEHKTGSIQLLGFHTKGDGGGGVFYWDSSKNKSEHNGGTVIDPDKAGLVANWASTQALYFTPEVTGQGCWVREYSGAVNVKWFGAKGDGVSDDTNAIQASLNSSAVKVYMPYGIYFINTSSITVPDNSFITGDGNSTKITCDASTRSDPTIPLFSVGSNCTVKNIHIDGDRDNAIQEIRSIFIDDGNSGLLLDNVILSNHGVGVQTGYCNNVIIANCLFSNGSSKVHLVTSGTVDGYTEDVKLVNCYLGTTLEESIDVNKKTRGLVVDSCSFFNSHTGGDVDGTESIDIGSASDCFDVTVSNNRFNGNLACDAFIWIKQGSSNVSVTGNVVKNLKTSGGSGAIRISNSKDINIESNTVLNSTIGVLFQERSSTVKTERVCITGNSFSGMTSDGFAMYAHTTPPSDIVVSDNHFDGTLSGGEGINIDQCDGLIFDSNTVVGFTGDGLQISPNALNLKINNNIVSECSDGITCLSPQASITNNTVLNNGGFGIRATAEKLIVNGNTSKENSSSGILLTGANNCIITNNVSTNNGTEGLLVLTDSSNVIVTSNQLSGNTGSSIGGSTKLIGSSVNLNNIV